MTGMDSGRSERDDHLAHQEMQEKLQACQSANSVGVTLAELSRILRKVDLRVIPTLAVLYLLSFLDRGNIGNAKIQGLATDLGLEVNQAIADASRCLTVFFFPYSFLEPLCNLLLLRLKPSIWLPSIMVAWGYCAPSSDQT
ncbi:hypothetical protein N7468_009279 [Penicillium chermesinum]|uniref:Uncharacterized protein n=1 Tax=Penicillium chermesinum TaxID=63820 RepID=A0A9W9NHH7_9EURO|nr:uncharacterized protein N7468_009279 [Penicillium chermesinum]KAJ5220075.1 hypothetical protein N7468_009279 [Penicillium chermesinum]